MIFLISFIVGLLNGLFASGAGQIFVFYLIFILKKDTHNSRALSISLLCIASIISFFGYSKLVDLNLKKSILLIIISIIFGTIGSKIMKKIPSNYLNLISGVTIVVLTLFKIIQGGTN